MQPLPATVSRLHTRHCRLTQRWEASLWLEGRQLYLGGFQTELDAARAYDIAALSCKGPHVVTNYPEEVYAQELQQTGGCSTVSPRFKMVVTVSLAAAEANDCLSNAVLLQIGLVDSLLPGLAAAVTGYGQTTMARIRSVASHGPRCVTSLQGASTAALEILRQQSHYHLMAWCSHLAAAHTMYDLDA